MKKSAVTFVAALVALATFWASDATAQARQASGTAKAAAAAAGKAGAAGKDAAGALKIKQITKMTGSSFLVSSPEFDGKVLVAGAYTLKEGVKLLASIDQIAACRAKVMEEKGGKS